VLHIVPILYHSYGPVVEESVAGAGVGGTGVVVVVSVVGVAGAAVTGAGVGVVEVVVGVVVTGALVVVVGAEEEALVGAEIGAVVAVTETTRETFAVCPAPFFAVYVRVYIPGVLVSTVPVTTSELEMSVLDASTAVAPGSRNTSPWLSEIAGEPLSVMRIPEVFATTGAVPVPVPDDTGAVGVVVVVLFVVFTGVDVGLRRFTNQLNGLFCPFAPIPSGVEVATCPAVSMIK